MNRNRYSYLQNTPTWMKAVGIGLTIIALIVFATAIRNGVAVLSLDGKSAKDLSELGLLGDFFGGHFSAFVGSITLLIVLFFSYHQAKQQEQHIARQEAQAAKQAERQAFLDGINLITQWDIQSPGCDQAMLLLDYYGRLATRSDDEELLLMLNTVITAQLRKNLEGKTGSYRRTNYPFACEAHERIRSLRERDGRAQRARLKQQLDPSVAGGR